MGKTWVSQDDVPTANAATRSRVAWLQPVVPAVHDALARYFAANPKGEDATLVAFEAIGCARLLALAAGVGRSAQVANHDVGMLAPLLLVERFGAAKVLTLRSGRISQTRPVPPSHLVYGWVKAYTPHQVIAG